MDLTEAEQQYEDRKHRLRGEREELVAKLRRAESDRDIRANHEATAREYSDTLRADAHQAAVFELDVKIRQLSQLIAGIDAQLQVGRTDDQGRPLTTSRLVGDPTQGYYRLIESPVDYSAPSPEPGWWKRTWRDHATSLVIGIVLLAIGVPAATLAAIWATNITGN